MTTSTFRSSRSIRKPWQMIPGLARQWAVSGDGRTIYFRIDPEARYSDGKPVRSQDFLVGAYIRVSDNIVNPYHKQYYRENVAQIAVYDDLTLSVSLPEAKIYRRRHRRGHPACAAAFLR